MRPRERERRNRIRSIDTIDTPYIEGRLVFFSCDSNASIGNGVRIE
jgi:hypothetical protein